MACVQVCRIYAMRLHSTTTVGDLPAPAPSSGGYWHPACLPCTSDDRITPRSFANMVFQAAMCGGLLSDEAKPMRLHVLARARVCVCVCVCVCACVRTGCASCDRAHSDERGRCGVPRCCRGRCARKPMYSRSCACGTRTYMYLQPCTRHVVMVCLLHALTTWLLRRAAATCIRLLHAVAHQPHTTCT